MNSRSTIRQVLAAIVAAAIALTPSSRLAMAMPSDAPAMAHDMVMPAMDDTQDMPQDLAMAMSGDAAVEAVADMPCCPHKAPSPVDCDKCGVLAGCAAQCFSGVVAIAGDLRPRFAASIVPQRKEARPASLGRPPPEYPPRSPV